MGTNHVATDCAALCDVDDTAVARALRRVTGPTPFTTRDYRRLLERPDIDAVYIATPDHWHALMTVHACQAGKHVYCEKPACRTAAEGRAMIDAARRARRVVQIGSQGRSNAVAHRACEFVRSGALGRVHRVDIWHENNPETKENPRPTDPPASLDWQMWLGPARERPYHAMIHPGAFRWYMEFGGGSVRDRGAHALSVVSWLLELDGYRGVVAVEAQGRPQLLGIYDVPIGLDAKWEFRDRRLAVTWTQPGTQRLGSSWGEVYHGSRDSLVVAKGDGACDTEEKAKRFEPRPGDPRVYLHPFDGSDTTARHRQNFLDCIRNGSRPAMDVEPGVRAALLCSLANLAFQLGRRIEFDFGRWRFTGDGAAALNERCYAEPYRAPWSL
jgi:predicted dehydrogenase